eukprot:1159498-Pelagomonas_calceolata.AAC.3
MCAKIASLSTIFFYAAPVMCLMSSSSAPGGGAAGVVCILCLTCSYDYVPCLMFHACHMSPSCDVLHVLVLCASGGGAAGVVCTTCLSLIPAPHMPHLCASFLCLMCLVYCCPAHSRPVPQAGMLQAGVVCLIGLIPVPHWPHFPHMV